MPAFWPDGMISVINHQMNDFLIQHAIPRVSILYAIIRSNKFSRSEEKPAHMRTLPRETNRADISHLFTLSLTSQKQHPPPRNKKETPNKTQRKSGDKVSDGRRKRLSLCALASSPLPPLPPPPPHRPLPSGERIRPLTSC